MGRRLPLALAALVCLAATGVAGAAPTFAGQWVNGSPVKLEMLRGKVVAMWLYEEG